MRAGYLVQAAVCASGLRAAGGDGGGPDSVVDERAVLLALPTHQRLVHLSARHTTSEPHITLATRQTTRGALPRT
eukprot:3660211-Rhodomonas_salina.1